MPGTGIAEETANTPRLSPVNPSRIWNLVFVNNRSLGRVMRTLDENVAPVFRRALALLQRTGLIQRWWYFLSTLTSRHKRENAALFPISEQQGQGKFKVSEIIFDLGSQNSTCVKTKDVKKEQKDSAFCGNTIFPTFQLWDTKEQRSIGS